MLIYFNKHLNATTKYSNSLVHVQLQIHLLTRCAFTTNKKTSMQQSLALKIKSHLYRIILLMNNLLFNHQYNIRFIVV